MHGEKGLPRGSVEHLEAKSVRVFKFRSVGPTVDFFHATHFVDDRRGTTRSNIAQQSLTL